MTAGQAWWESPEQLSDVDLRTLVQAASSVLAREGDGQVPGDLAQMPQSMVAQELRTAVEQQGVSLDERAAERIARGDLARGMAIEVVRELGRDPDLRAAIDEAYEASRQLMVLDPGTLAVAALLVIAVKIRRVRVGGGNVDVQFDPVKAGILSRITELIGL
jgi:hypothetical protein